MKRLHWCFFALFVFYFNSAYSQDPQVSKVEPPFWWVGMKSDFLQLMVYGENISKAEPEIQYPGVKIEKVHRVSSPNYLFIDLNISGLKVGSDVPIRFTVDGRTVFVYDYSFYERREGSAERTSFTPEDVIYLLMPDRFANGDPSNDDMPGMLELSERTNPNGRHGGDIQGVINNMDYIKDLGMTAIWSTPFQENNMQKFSYHGYAITNFYKVDARHGTNEDYLKLVEECHEKGLKVIMDMVFNHCGTGHWWMKDLPDKDWINQWPEFTRSNYRNPILPDPYSSQYDFEKMQKGWFDKTMADMNQHHPLLAYYLMQNSIWWVEYANLDGIRMDTYPYAFQDFMAGWVKHVLTEYPHFNILGECWLQKEALTGYFDGNPGGRLGPTTYLPSLTDFPMMFSMEKALNKKTTWTEGLSAWYYVLTQDLVYDNPYYNVTFPDNHDISRFYTRVEEDLDKYKMGIAFLLTTRGIPMIYYGTEILMTGDEHDGHGYIREDFPGGWSGDEVNTFKEVGLNEDQADALEFTRKLLNWRKGNDAIHQGKLTQFIPQDTTYVYFRKHEDKSVMVILNQNHVDKTVETSRYQECLEGYKRGKSAITGRDIEDLKNITVPAMGVEIIDLKK